VLLGGRFDPFKVYSIDEMSDETGSTLPTNWQTNLASYNPYVRSTNAAAKAWPQNITDAWLVNGVHRPTVTGMAVGEMRVLRVVMAQASHVVEVCVLKGNTCTTSCSMYVSARDGVYSATISKQTSVYLLQASRTDLIVSCTAAGTYSLGLTNTGSQPLSITAGSEVFLTFTVSLPAKTFTLPSASAWPAKPYYFDDLLSLTDAQITGRHNISLAQDSRAVAACGYFINHHYWTNYDDYQHVAHLGDVQEWSIVGLGNQLHPYHQHVNHFQIVGCETNVGNGQVWAIGEWRDVFPAFDGVCKIRFRYNTFYGPIIYHCHFLGHEDRGMMHIAYVCNSTDTTAKCTGDCPTCCSDRYCPVSQWYTADGKRKNM
jgi:FtsP/CotA-like multicopper oxidase with cupredoxin domain